ncbi:MAG: Ig-like domain-containing protein [Eubacterium sp.]|nr:Ig-like domain-containing protein [Eubacterium sp.]
MKRKIMAIVLSLALIVSGVSVNTGKVNAAETKVYSMGTAVSGTITKTVLYTLVSYSTDTYTFNTNKDMDVSIVFTANQDSLRWTLSSSGSGNYLYEYNTVAAGMKNTYKMFLPAGSYTFKVTGGGSAYSFIINKSNACQVKFAKASGSISGGVKKNVAFTYNCTYDYAKKYFSMKNSNTKVADCVYSLNTDGTGTITLDPKKIGKTKISISLAGGNTAMYTGTVKSMYLFVAKGKTVKAPKPSGVKKVKWSSKKKKVATVNKKGKVKGKKDGRGKVIAKAGKTKYTYHIVVTDFIKLGKKVYKEIEENVRNPEKFKIYNVYSGFDKNIIKGVSIPVIFVDFGYPNSNGAMERGKWIAFYDDVHELKYFSVSSYSDLMKRKTIKPSKIKR